MIASRSGERKIGEVLLYPKIYQKLLNSIEQSSLDLQSAELAAFVNGWYPSLGRPGKRASERGRPVGIASIRYVAAISASGVLRPLRWSRPLESTIGCVSGGPAILVILWATGRDVGSKDGISVDLNPGMARPRGTIHSDGRLVRRSPVGCFIRRPPRAPAAQFFARVRL